ncbi:helix-turn-helix domain-containing protein [Vibrio alginolyticus]
MTNQNNKKRVKTIKSQYDLTLAITTLGCKGLGLNTNQWVTLIALSDYYPNCLPSVPKLVEHTGMGKNRIIKATQDLEKLGYIVKNRRFNNSNTYTFNIALILKQDNSSPKTGQTMSQNGNLTTLLSNTNNNTTLKDTGKESKDNQVDNNDDSSNTPSMPPSTIPHEQSIPTENPSKASSDNGIVFTSPTPNPILEAENELPPILEAPDLDFNPYDSEQEGEVKAPNPNQGWNINDIPF